ncbi:xeroderma pigmentosum group C-complementing protein [Rutstroemia sp. NJR-2017a BVV2]|nr:xeroderma pigmentosum group C-complementing protein [Rutstroemia sp. NJR-2017a BVV2]
MPPFLPRKRLRSSSPEPEPGPSRNSGGKRKKATPKTITPRKATLFDDLDASASTSSRDPNYGKSILQKIQATEDDDSSLTSLSDDEFEDVPSAKRPAEDNASDDEDEDMEFEDIETNVAPAAPAYLPTGDLELTLTKETRISLTNPLGTKKGPSKIERGIRVSTHKVHVLMLMWHNAIRNAWLCDKELQSILVGHLPETVRREIEKWRKDSGLSPTPNEKEKPKSKGKGKATMGKKTDVRSQRDWGEPAERLAAGEVNMSRGDPLFRLLRLLMTYWKQRFRIVAPGLRKLGYMSLPRLDQEMKSFNKEEHDPEKHGERIADINEFRNCAKALEGSRDVGAQLFTALLRGIGIEARMVTSLQPVGFGWNKNEDAAEKKDKKKREATPVDESSDSDSSSREDQSLPKPTAPKKGKGKATPKPKPAVASSKATPSRRTSRGKGLKNAPIDLSESEAEDDADGDDDDSVVDITPAKTRPLPSKPYDKDLLYPHYWTEVLSPVTHTYTPVDAVVLNIIASNSELIQKFEPRGAKADKAKQVTAYIVGHSPDSTAKDVTIRYLKNHMLPGRTKGNRIPVEKVPIYNSRGKIKRYEYFDWFKTVMNDYVRGTKKCPRTEIDDAEEATDLKSAQPKKKEIKEGEETLQSYKSSETYVLERHLRREEAILPTAKHVKMFTVKGKGDTGTEEKVFLRKDVVNCKSMETWHKEGRAPLPDAIPRKRVPYRAATTNRKRELAEAEHASGEKMLQGLYSRDQTDWIIPPPIENGVIPKNSFGNMDVYVPSMVPEGAVHIPRRGTMKICKRLGIDYAEAVTGFEFGARMAIPIITGVVVAEEHLEAVMEEWEKDEAERVRKEDEKRTKAAVGMWRKMLMGLRILERMREEYGNDAGDEVDLMNPWTNNNKGKQKEGEGDLEEEAARMQQQDEDMAGGFFPEGHEEEEPDAHHSTSFFPVVAQDEHGDEDGGGFIVEDESKDKDSGGGGFVVGNEDFDEEPAKKINSYAYPKRGSLLSNTAAGLDAASDSDEEMKPEIKTTARTPVRKGRGRPKGSTKKPIQTPPKPRTTPAKRISSSTTKTSHKRKRIIQDSDEEVNGSAESSSLSEPGNEKEDESSALSELEDDEDDEVVVPKRSAAKRKPAKSTPGTRRTPGRNAKRKGETELRSRYFEHSGDEDEDDEG